MRAHSHTGRCTRIRKGGWTRRRCVTRGKRETNLEEAGGSEKTRYGNTVDAERRGEFARAQSTLAGVDADANSHGHEHENVGRGCGR